MTPNGSISQQASLDPAIRPEPGLQAEVPSSPDLGGVGLDGRSAAMPGAWLALLLLLSINLFNYIDRQVLAANLTAIEEQLLPPGGADNGERLGNLAMAFMLSYMVFAPLFGWLADHLPRWRLVGIGVILWSLASGASGLAGTFASQAGLPASLPPALRVVVGTFGFLLLTRCFVGIGEAAYGPVAPTLISDLYPIKVRGSVLSWFYAAIPVGSALGYALGGVAGWPWAFYLVVPPGLLLGVWCFCMPEPPPGQADMGPGASVRRARLVDYLVLLRTPSYVLNTLGMAALTFALGGMGHWMPDYIKHFRHEQGTTIGPFTLNPDILFGLIIVVSGLGATLLGGWVGDRLRTRFAGSYFLVSGVAMLLGFPLVLAVMYTPFPLAWLFLFLCCFCLFFNTGPTNTILANVTHPAIRAQGFALNIFFIHLLGDAISPRVIGQIADAYGSAGQRNMDAGFLAVSVMVLVGGVLWLAGVPFLARDTARAPHRLDVG
jgi:MFS family permease